MKAKIEGGNLVLRRRTRPQPSGVSSPRLIRPRGAILWVIMILVAVVLALMTTMFLRRNNLNMVELRNQLVQIDQTGDVAQVQSAARKLQNYAAHHMNTTTGRIALQTLYNQAAEQAMEASKPPEISTDVYQQATEDCKPQLTSYGYRAWASCVATKVGLNATTTLTVADQVAPDPDLYYVEYAPARWSADPAGICLLLTIVVIAVLVIKLLAVLVGWLIRRCHKS